MKQHDVSISPVVACTRVPCIFQSSKLQKRHYCSSLQQIGFGRERSPPEVASGANSIYLYFSEKQIRVIYSTVVTLCRIQPFQCIICLQLLKLSVKYISVCMFYLYTNDFVLIFIIFLLSLYLKVSRRFPENNQINS